MPQKLFLILSLLSGTCAVSLGPFGAHALKAKLEASQLLSTYNTAIQYHFYHTLLLLAIGILMYHIDSKWLTYSGYFTLAGILLFSGSLYVLCLSNVRWLGAITPIGGVCFILGWVLLALAIWKQG